jgi:hypothetical protein
MHFERNLMPHMLGWFALRADTSVEDAEWLLARAAGFDAGFALAASLASTAQLEADPESADAAKQFGAIPSKTGRNLLFDPTRPTPASQGLPPVPTGPSTPHSPFQKRANFLPGRCRPLDADAGMPAPTMSVAVTQP